MAKQEHISIDLETLGTGDDAIITAVALAVFDIETGSIIRTYYDTVNVDFEKAVGAELDFDTIRWWATQDPAVFRESLSGRAIGPNICADIQNFIDIERCVGIWGNGATFDVTKLGRFFKRYDSTAPWDNNHFWPGGFRYIRDMRTLIDVARAKGFDDKGIPFDGDRHNALADACHQAKVISEAWNFLTK